MDDEELKRMEKDVGKRLKELKHDHLEVPIEWPPKDHTVLRWQAHGLECAVCRGHGSLCGYVRVPDGHPAFGKWYDDVDVDVHGGLTFAQIATDGGHWLGFDCAHAWDWIGFSDPKTGYGYEHPGKIWTVDDVKAETERLAEQLAMKDNSS